MNLTLSKKNLLQFVLVGAGGLLLAVLLALTYQREEQARLRVQFEQVAQQDVLQAGQSVDDALNDLVALRALFEVSNGVSRAQFDAFTRPLLERNAGIQALEWIPRVPAAQRSAVEQAARRDGFASFQITQRSAQGRMVPVQAKPEYDPVDYVAPYKGNETALGFDLSSNPARRAALLKSAASGAMVATSRIVLVQDKSGQYGFLVFYPVFRDAGTPRAELAGFVLGVFKLHSLIEKGAGPDSARSGVHLAVFDTTDHAAGTAASVLYPKEFATPLPELLRDRIAYQEPIQVGGRNWLMLAYATPALAPTLQAGLIFCFVLAAVLLVMALMRQTLISQDREAQRSVAQRSDAAKSQFLANVSHEIRTPLNGVIGMLDLLLQSSLLPAQMKMAEVSRRSAVVLLSIINDLLDFSKIEAGKFDIVHDPLDLELLAKDVVEFFKPLARKANCGVSLFVDPRLPRNFSGDEIRLRQILTNLVSNAVKFSGGRDKRGEVALRALRHPGRDAGEEVVIEVADNGIGIDAEALQRLFQPFEQADLGTTKRYGGTGLGLSISRHLIELMGGSIDVRSSPGRGSTFTLRLPLQCVGKLQDMRSDACAGLRGALCGPASQLREDIAVYLDSAGLALTHMRDLPQASALARLDLLVWCATSASAPQQEFAALLAATGARREDYTLIVLRDPLQAVVVAARGAPEASTEIDVVLLARADLLEAVQWALGRSAAPEHRPVETAPATPLADAARQAPILVAEDNETNRQVIRLQLERCGWRADMAEDGAQALRMWRAGSYALVLSDLHMPEMDGFQLAAEIRRIEAAEGRPRTPLLAVTAAALERELQRAVDAGMDGYVTKPIEIEALRRNVAQWLQADAAAPEPAAPEPPAEAAPLPQDDVAAITTQASPVTAHLDVGVLKNLVGDDAETISALLAQYRHELDQARADLGAALAAHDLERIASLAHKLKSSSRSVGAAALGDCCAALESAGREGQTQLLSELGAGFAAEAAAVEKDLQAYMPS
jgi:signal transduction histidine kinase/CheY-like chemotaxis protein/HPt (histidine-containing phosphotransfer) domain-containing protein